MEQSAAFPKKQIQFCLFCSTQYQITENSKVAIDFSNSKSISYDVLELIRDYEVNAKTKNIIVEKINYKDPYGLGNS